MRLLKLLALMLLVLLLPHGATVGQEAPTSTCQVFLLNVSPGAIHAWFLIPEYQTTGDLGVLMPGQHADITGPCISSPIFVRVLDQEGNEDIMTVTYYRDGDGSFHPHIFVLYAGPPRARSLVGWKPQYQT